MILRTVGHGNRSAEELIELPKRAGVSYVVDVRSIPHSVRFPHFDSQALRSSLRRAGIDYIYLGDLLGGKPLPHEQTADTQWKQGSLDARLVASLRRTPRWKEGLQKLAAIFRAAMSPEVIITDVTRMQPPNRVCIAADHKGRTIRLADPTPTDEWIASVGGLLPGDVVSVDWKPARRPVPPHREDGEWVRRTFSKRRRLTEEQLTDYLSAKAFRSIRDAFGAPCHHGSGGNAAFQPGTGTRSLASIWARSVRAYPHDEGIRVDFADDEGTWRGAPLQDLVVRQHQRQCPACSLRFSRLLTSEFQAEKALLRVGLTRKWGEPPLCWLQVTHIFPIPLERKHFV